MNIREKFLQLTQFTEVLGQEHLIRQYLPKELKKDSVGNYWMKVGESDTMFASHLDTAAFSRKKVNHEFDEMTTKNGRVEQYIETDGTTILGADDRTGVVIMMYMIEHKIPGLYYFFIGEESGTVGSSNAVEEFPEFFEPYKKCISFDRRGYGSVITVQMGSRCCSPAFANQLAKELTAATGYHHEGDTTGIYTDSAVFMDLIPECTNLSVGYFNEHSVSEYQNLTYLEDICEGFLKVKWEELPIERDPGPLDTPNPKRKPKKDGDLDDRELGYVFMMIEEIFEDTQQKDCVNRDNFIPEKEMLFVSYYDDENIVSVWVHEDGSITIGKDKFKDIYDLEDKVKAVYGWESKWAYSGTSDYDDDDLPFDPDEPEEIDVDEFDDIDLDKNTFADDIDINDFIGDIKKLNLKNIPAYKINKILNKYNKTIESLVIWLYHNGNNPDNTFGLSWDDEGNQFDFDKDYNIKSTGVDKYGARDFND